MLIEKEKTMRQTDMDWRYQNLIFRHTEFEIEEQY